MVVDNDHIDKGFIVKRRRVERGVERQTKKEGKERIVQHSRPLLGMSVAEIAHKSLPQNSLVAPFWSPWHEVFTRQHYRSGPDRVDTPSSAL
jgi:hypothetical protein